MLESIAVKPVDYKGGELSNLNSSEFHHITDTVFFILRAGVTPALLLTF